MVGGANKTDPELIEPIDVCTMNYPLAVIVVLVMVLAVAVHCWNEDQFPDGDYVPGNDMAIESQ